MNSDGSSTAIPRDRAPDSTLAFLTEGYTFVTRRCRRYGSDAFETRLLGERAVCMQGEEAASVFYEPERFTRKRALPRTGLELLLDFGSVGVLDGEAHHHRKAMFLSLMTREGIADLAQRTAEEWRSALRRWENADRVVLSAGAREVLCRAVCAWTGVPLPEAQVERRAYDLMSMFDGAGSAGPRNVRGHLCRKRTEAWVEALFGQVRAGAVAVPQGSAVETIAWHRGLDGGLLTAEVAAVELINLLRPTVAIARYVVFAALALHEHPACREALRAGGDDEVKRFAQEVRRFYPFFPVIGGRVKEAFDWRGHHFPRGRWVLLDLYGTNHDPRVWERPDVFEPERFRDWNGSPFAFIPQGGGDHRTGHRCAGEWVTIALLEVIVGALVREMDYRLPPQDLRVSLRRMPAIPRSGVVIDGVRQAA